MYEIKIVKDENLEYSDLTRICFLKGTIWKYSLESQIQWIKENFKPLDLHIMVLKDLELVSYASLVNVNVIIDQNQVSFLGIGSVCSIRKGAGYGIHLMETLSNYLLSRRLCGILFCKNDLVRFYQKFEWKLIDKSQIKFSIDVESNFNTMIFNYDRKFELLQYADRLI